MRHCQSAAAIYTVLLLMFIGTPLAMAGAPLPDPGLAEFDNETLFLNQTGGSTIELPGGGVPGTPSFGGVTISAHTGSTLANNVTPLLDPDFGLSGVESFNVALDSPAFGFGLQFVDQPAVASTFSFTLYNGGPSGLLVDSFLFERPFTGVGFVGGVSNTAFDYIEIREIIGSDDNEGFGRLSISSAPGKFWGESDGSWDTGANWADFVAPISTDNVFITPSASVTIAGPAAATTVESLTIDNQDHTLSGGAGTTTLNLGGGPLTVTGGLVLGATATDSGSSLLNVGTGTLNVGGDTNIRPGGTLSIPSGGTFAPTGAVNLEGGTLSVDSIGSLTPSWTSGTLEVTGAGGFSVNAGGPLGGNPIDIGSGKTLSVTNTLNIFQAADFQVTGGTVNAGSYTSSTLGTLTVTSGEVNIAGTLDNQADVVLQGGTTTVNTFDTRFGNFAFDDGELVIDGGSFMPSALSNDFNLSGDPGTPTLTLQNGATMALSITGTFSVALGANDNAVLNIHSGSTVTSGMADVGGISYASDAIINVDGTGSSWEVTGNLDLGHGNVTNQDSNRGRDQLNVSDGAEVEVSGMVTIATTGIVTLSGGSITATTWVRNAESQFTHTGGTLTIDGGSFGSGSSNFSLTGADRPEIQMINGATHSGGNINVINGEWHLLSGSTINATDFQVYNGTGSAGYAQIDGAGSTATFSSIVSVGTLGGHGVMHITNGASVSNNNYFEIGAGEGVNGVLLVDGTDTTLNVSGGSGLFVGNEGLGLLDVTGGAVVTANILTVADSDGGGNSPTSVLTISGDDGNGNLSTLSVIGSSFIGGSTNEDGGTGVLIVEAGARYNSNGGVIGSGDGSGPDGTGTVTVTGAGSFWNSIANGTSDIYVGDTGSGKLNVLEGGRVDADAMFIGRLAGSEAASVIIDGSTSVVNVSGVMVVGSQRRGTLTLTDGATLNTSTNGNSEFLIGNTTTADNSPVLVDNSDIVHNGTGRVAVGDESNGTASSLTLQNGGTFTAANSTLFVADISGSTGALTVDGEGSLLSVGPRIAMGDNGIGTMTVSNGGDVEVTDASGYFEVAAASGGGGTLTVTDPGSTLTVGNYLSVGDEANVTGTLDIQNGGLVSTGGHAYISRQNSGTVGVITVEDLDLNDGSTGSTLNVGEGLYLGGNVSGGGGNATLNVNAGGTVNVTTLLKLWDNGQVHLNGGTINTATFDLENPPEFPQPDFMFTSGTFRYTGGATLNAETLNDLLGPAVPTLAAGQNLVVTDQAVVNSALRLNGGSLSVGSVFGNDLSTLDFDTGTFNLTQANLTVGAGGLFGSAMVVDLGQTVNVTNQATIDAGSELTILGDFSSGGLTNNGDLIVIDTTGSGKTINGAINSPAGSNITLVGNIEFADGVSGGADFYGPGTPEFAASYSPGDSPAEVFFESGLTLAETNTLLIEIAGAMAGDEYDTLSVAGDAMLDGVLSVALDGFTPTAGQQFTILTANSVIDNGLVLGGPDASSFSLLVNSDSVILQALVGTALSGDFNGDGTVNLADYTLWRNHLGAADDTAINNAGDNVPGITTADYDVWKGNFGATSSSAAAIIDPVPEPSTACTLLVLMGLGGWRARQTILS